MIRRWNRWVVLLAATAMVSTACSGTPSGKDEAGRVALRLEASSQGGGYPTPYAAIRGPGRLLTTFMFDTLLFPDVTGEPKPWLATSWMQSADGLTWTFDLNERAKWHDGKPLTAEDVEFSFDYDLNGPGASTGAAQGLNYIDQVTAKDPSTVVITLKRPTASFLTDIAGAFGVAIVPKHIWSEVSDPAHFRGEKALIGSGPYRLQEFTVSPGSFHFVANDDFYLGKPKVKDLKLIQVSDPLLALQRGDIDAGSPFNSVTPKAQVEALTKKFKRLTAPGEFNEALFFNLDAGFPYEERAFRQAVAFALDREDMITRLVGGNGIPGSAGALGPTNPFLNKDVAQYPHDPTKAKSLLDGLGIKDADGDGMRDKPDGSPFTVKLLTSATDIKQAQLVDEYLRAVDLTVKIESVDQPTSDARTAKGAYSMAVVHFGGLAGDPGVLADRFASDSTYKSFTRVSGYNNGTFDKLAAQQASEIDRAKRSLLVDQMQQILATDIPQLPLYIPRQVAFVDMKKFKGWAYTRNCPPCGVSMNKRNLFSGSPEPVPTQPNK